MGWELGFVVHLGIYRNPVIRWRYTKMLHEQCQRLELQLGRMTFQKGCRQSTVSRQRCRQVQVFSAFVLLYLLQFCNLNYVICSNAATTRGACRILASQKTIALDCEGENLGPAGKLSLVTLAAADGQCWIFDCRQGFNPFPWGLKQLLEDASVVKLTFDCRSDAANLQNQYGVGLAGIRDLQLFEVWARMGWQSNERRIEELCGALRRKDVLGQPHLYKRLHRLESFHGCMAKFGIGGSENKKLVSEQFRSDPKYWMKELPPEAWLYASQDAQNLFKLLKALKKQPKLGNFDVSTCQWLADASKKYAQLKLAFDGRYMYMSHSILPLDIVPENLPMCVGRATCTKCKRSLRIFSKGKNFRKSKFKCDVCRAIDIDTMTKSLVEKESDYFDCCDYHR